MQSIYLRDKNIKDGGPVYMNRPVPTKEIYQDNINILVNMIKAINEKDIISFCGSTINLWM